MKLTQLIVILLIFLTQALADTIFLSDNSSIKGVIVEDGETFIKLKTSYGVMKIDKSNIVKIIKDESQKVADKINHVRIMFDDGTTINGEIVSETDDGYELEITNGAVLQVMKSKVRSITQYDEQNASANQNKISASNYDRNEEHWQSAISNMRTTYKYWYYGQIACAVVFGVGIANEDSFSTYMGITGVLISRIKMHDMNKKISREIERGQSRGYNE